MPVTTLDATTALVIIDLQHGVVTIPAAHPVDAVVGRASTLADAFRRRALPVVLVQAVGGALGRTEHPRNLSLMPDGWTEFVPELHQQPDDHVVAKRTWGAFTHTDLEPHLRARGVTQVVIAGVATSLGVESTARHAYELGFHVTLATDAMTDRSVEAHRNSVTRIFPRLGETGTTQEVLARLGALVPSAGRGA